MQPIRRRPIAVLPLLGTFLLGGGVALALAATPALTQRQDGHAGAQQAAPPPDLSAAMAAMAKYTAPGEHHKELSRFLGDWNTETRILMPGMPADQMPPPEKGSVHTAWLMKDRWLKTEMKGSMMGMPIEGFIVMGYDNFKQSFVSTSVTNMDTAMIRLEGDMDQTGSTLILYGLMDEYMTGEHDKVVKYVWRFTSPDAMTLEVHDMAIGETNTEVIEVKFTRSK